MHHQGYFSEVLLLFGVQDLSPFWWVLILVCLPQCGLSSSHWCQFPIPMAQIQIHPLAQEVQGPLGSSRCLTTSGDSTEAERSRFLPQTPLGAPAILAVLRMLARCGTAGGGLAEAAGIRRQQGRDQRAKVPAPARAAGGDTLALAGSQAAGTRVCRPQRG